MLRIARDLHVRKKTGSVLRCLYQQRERNLATNPNVVSSADVVVVGGGIAGCNLLYQLTKRGVNAVLVERSKITSGTTWHTAGLVWSLRPSDLEVRLLRDSRRVYNDLADEVEGYAGWINCGGMFISRSKTRTEEYMRLHTLGNAMGIPSKLLDPKEAQKIVPILDPSVFEMALHSPQDGTIDPAMACDALLKVAMKHGAKVYEDCSVLDINYDYTQLGNKQVTGVHTEKGVINTKCVVNCGGAWGARVARFAGIPALPLLAFKHAYVVMDALPEVRGCPIVRDHDANLYLKIQGETVSVGGYEPNPIMLDDLPENLQFHLYELDWDVFGVHMSSAVNLCPKLADVGVKSTVCGPESFTPDHKPIVGEDPNMFGLYHNCGYNSAGMMFSAGVGIQLAEWIIHGRPSYNMFTFDVRRFTPAQTSRPHWNRESSHEAYAKNYSIVFPNDEPLAGRDCSHDTLHQQIVEDGGVMQSRAGWERVGFFLPGEVARVQHYDWYGYYGYPRNEDRTYKDVLTGDYTFQFSKYHDVIGAEALAARNSAALFNMSYYGKLYLTGPDAQRTAELAFTANLQNKENKVVYSLLLNERGGVEADVTVSVLDGGTGQLHGPIFKGRGYYIVSSGFNAAHTTAHLRRLIEKNNLRATVTDVSKQLCVLSLQGPNSQKILQRYTDVGLSNDMFPLYDQKSIDLHIEKSNITCRALRVSWVGELGWELHVPSASALQLYNSLKNADGLTCGGWRALTSLSAEKGFHLWNADLRSDDNPVEANLSFTCRKDGHYIGYKAVNGAKHSGITKKYAFFTLDEQVPLFGQEAIYRDGEPVGYLRRGDYGYYLHKPIGIGYISNRGMLMTADYLKAGTYEIEVMGKKYPATLHLRSPFDPHSHRMLGNYGDEEDHEPHSGQNERAGGSE